jgi:hypothetical protein
MASKKPTPSKALLSAVETIFQELNPLEPDTRQKVLASVYALLGTPGPTAPPIATAPIRTPVQSPGASGADVPSTEKRLSLVELVTDRKASTNAQRLALFAYYREKVEGQPHFARGDLKKYFSIARIPPPANYDRDFNEAVKRGWIHEEEDQSYLTSRGTEAVFASFQGERRGDHPVRKGKKKGGRRKGRKPARSKR